MAAVEFHAQVIDGKIEVPQEFRDQFSGKVGVLLFSPEADRDQSAWPAQNRRRWELIAKEAAMGLTDAEAAELAMLEQHADQQLAEVGPRPMDSLERLYAKLTEQD